VGGRSTKNTPNSLRVRFRELDEVFMGIVLGQQIECIYKKYEGERDSDNEIYLLAPSGGAELEVRSRTGGESLRVGSEGLSRNLKSLFQKAKIPTWRRDSFPLIYIDGVFSALGVHFKSVDCEPKTGEPVLLVRFV
jgi:tRNA(Ile)-lysidine synthase